MNLETRTLGAVAGGTYSRAEISSGVQNPFLLYLQTIQVPVLPEEQKQRTQPFIPSPVPSKAGDAVVQLIGKMHAHGVVLKRFEEKWPYDPIHRREDAIQSYFGLARKRAFVAAPEAFVHVNDAYLEKYFGRRPECDRDLYRKICHELFFDLSRTRGGIGDIIDPTPSESYQNAERA